MINKAHFIILPSDIIEFLDHTQQPLVNKIVAISLFFARIGDIFILVIDNNFYDKFNDVFVTFFNTIEQYIDEEYTHIEVN